MSAPFGIKFYSPLESLEVLEDIGQAQYMVAAPRPHPRFETYSVQATPSLGVVMVKGFSPSVENDAFGRLVRSLRQELEAQASKRYGLGKSVDFLLPGSIWTDDRDYVMSITQNERKAGTIWERPSVNLPDDIEAIILDVNGKSNHAARIGLACYSRKAELAEAEVQDMLSDLL
jgi:hypothetical protein